MSRPLRLAVLLVAAVGTLALGGCRGGVAAAPTPGVVSAGGVPGGAADAAGAPADPLGSIESSIAAVEKQVDQDGTG